MGERNEVDERIGEKRVLLIHCVCVLPITIVHNLLTNQSVRSSSNILYTYIFRKSNKF